MVRMRSPFISFFLLFLSLCCVSLVATQSISISTDKSTVGLGQSVKVFVKYTSSSSNVANITVWPFVNGLQWGSSPMTNESGQAIITLPFPNAGTSEIVVCTISNQMPAFTVGQAISSFSVSLSSNKLDVTVTDRQIIGPDPNRGFYVSMEWEPWFTPTNDAWVVTEAIPIIGRYDSYNTDVIKQHSIWMSEAGVDSLIVDWTNNLWGKQHWNERNEDIQELCNATTALLETYTNLSSSSSFSFPVPKIILLLGLDNGIQASTTAVVEELDLYMNHTLPIHPSPKICGLFTKILDTGNEHANLSFPTDDTRFTIRWMGTQSQVNGYNKLGFWSWMDGSLDPLPTYYNGTVEALTVTPAFFDPSGWLDPNSYPRLGGTTFVEQFKYAHLYPPKFLVINQWNEFAGQANGQGYGPNKDIFMDTYSLTLSDDIEPTDISICAYPRPNQKCGGWGFFYLNLLRALNNIHQNNNFTILTVGSPEPMDVVNTTTIKVTWNIIGVEAKAISVFINQKQYYYEPTSNSAVLDISDLPNGITTLTVSAVGAQTPYSLSYDEVDIAQDPMITPTITVDFILAVN